MIPVGGAGGFACLTALDWKRSPRLRRKRDEAVCLEVDLVTLLANIVAEACVGGDVFLKEGDATCAGVAVAVDSLPTTIHFEMLSGGIAGEKTREG